MTTAKEITSNIQVETSLLKESDIDQIDPILKAHVRDSETGELIAGEIEDIKGCMRGKKDEYGRIRTYIVARDQSGKILGCMAYATPDPDMIKHFNLGDSNDSAELLNAFVSPEVFRGGGVGKKLLDAVFEEGRKKGKGLLLIHSGPRYQKSWGFYDKVSDEQSGFIQDKYGKGRHAKAWKIKLK
jgi:GNAT superfamily N-acetyltransferase